MTFFFEFLSEIGAKFYILTISIFFVYTISGVIVDKISIIIILEYIVNIVSTTFSIIYNISPS